MFNPNRKEKRIADLRSRVNIHYYIYQREDNSNEGGLRLTIARRMIHYMHTQDIPAFPLHSALSLRILAGGITTSQ